MENRGRAYGELEYRYTQEHQQCEELMIRLQNVAEINKKVVEYESRIAVSGQEIERLNGSLKNKVEDNNNLDNRLRTSQQ